MDEASLPGGVGVPGEVGEPPPRSGAEPDGTERLEALEHQVRQLMSRLAVWVESQLVQAVDDRRSDLRALRSEIQAVLNEQVASARAESTSMLTVATRRLSANQEEMGERLEDVASRTADAAAAAAALSLSATTEGGRLESLEHQLSQRIGRLGESVQAQLTDAADRRRAEMEALRSELEAMLAEGVHAVARQADQTSELVAAMGASAEAEAARTEAFEERLRSAMNRLAESLETRLAGFANTRLADIEAVRGQLQAALDERIDRTAAANASVLGAVVERMESVAGQVSESAEAVAALTSAAESETARALAFEDRVRSALARVTETVDARLAEVDVARQGALETFRAELQSAFDERVREVGAEATLAVQGLAHLSASVQAEAGRSQALEDRVRAALARLAQSVDSRLVEALAGRQDELYELRAEIDAGRVSALDAFRTELQGVLDERLPDIAARASRAGEGVVALAASVEAQTARVEAFEERVRVALSRLGESVDARLGEAATTREADLGALRREVQAAVDATGQGTVETFRAELQSAIDERVREVGSQATAAVEGLAHLSATVQAEAARSQALEDRVRAALARLAESVDARLAEALAGRQGEVDELRAAIDAGRGSALDAFRTELQGVLDERLRDIAARASQAGEGVVALTASMEAETARAEAFEERVRGAMFRLTETVDTRLGEVATGRDSDIEALRSELRAALDQRFEAIAGQTVQAAERLAAVSSSVEAETARVEALDERVRVALSGITASVDARLTEAAALREADLEGVRTELAAAVHAGRDAALAGFRTELQAVLDERLAVVGSQVAQTADQLAAVSSSVEAEAARTATFEDRVRTAVARLTESVDARLAETAAHREVEVARAEALEEAVRGAIADLTESVDGRLSEAAVGREAEAEALRSQLEAALDERLRLVAREAADGLAGLTATVEAEAARSAAFEERVRSVVSRLTESVEAVAATSTTRQADVESLAVELRAVIDERLEVVARQAAHGVAGVTATLEAETARMDAFEHRVRAAMGRLTDSVESQLADSAAGRQSELETLRSQLQSSMTDQVANRVGEIVDARLADVVERRRVELETLRGELEGALTQQLADARSQIAAAVAGANRRFVRAHEQLRDRTEAVARRAAGAAEKVDLLTETVSSLERSTAPTDEQLARLVEAQVVQVTGDREAGMEALRTDLEAALARNMEEVRSQMAAAAADLDRKLVGVETHLDQRVTEVAEQLAAAAPGLDAVTASLASEEARLDAMEERVRRSEDRLAKAVQAELAASAERRAAEVTAIAAELGRVRSELTSAAEAQAKTSKRAHDRLRQGLEEIAGRVQTLASAVAGTGMAEAGALAPLRSDVRLLQAKVAELTEALVDTRTRRRAPAAPPATPAPAPRPPAVRTRKAVVGAKAAPRKATATKAVPSDKRPSRATKNGQ